MNKRGAEETGKVLWELLILICVLIVVGSLLIFLLRFFLASGDTEKAATLAGHQSLTSVISGVANSREVFSSNFNDPLQLYIGEKFIVVGFNKGDSKPVDGCGLGDIERVARPSECGDSACLCVYPLKGQDTFELAGSPAQPAACSTFSNVDFITSFWYHYGGGGAFEKTDAIATSNVLIGDLAGQCDDSLPDTYMSKLSVPWTILHSCRTPGHISQYASFVAYGSCPPWNRAWGSQQVYVERVLMNGKSVVLISSMPSESFFKQRQAAVQVSSKKPLFDAAELLFNQQKYTDAIVAYQKFIDVAHDETALRAEVQTARFKISESSYRGNDFKSAATAALAYMRAYGVRSYFLDAGLPSFTPLPLPMLTTNNAAPLSTLATPEEVSLAQERFTKLQTALPDNAVFAYLLGHLERRALNEDRAIILLEQAAHTIAPSDVVSPFAVLYELGNAYVQKLQKIGFEKDLAEGLVNVDADIVGGYGDTLPLLEMYNNANSRLAWDCFVWKNTFGSSEPCSLYQVALANDDGWLSTVKEGNACTVPEGMLRCGDLTLQNLQDVLGTGGGVIGYTRPELHDREGYHCVDGKWTKAFMCPEKQYCENIRDFNKLGAQCFTPKDVETAEAQP